MGSIRQPVPIGRAAAAMAVFLVAVAGTQTGAQAQEWSFDPARGIEGVAEVEGADTVLRVECGNSGFMSAFISPSPWPAGTVEAQMVIGRTTWPMAFDCQPITDHCMSGLIEADLMNALRNGSSLAIEGPEGDRLSYRLRGSGAAIGRLGCIRFY